MTASTPQKTLLMLALDFPPCQSAGVQRTLKFAQYLPEFGWSPEILTVRPEVYEKVDPGQALPGHLDGKVHRAWGLNTVKHLSVKGKYLGFTELPDRYWTWYSGAVRLGRRIIRERSPALLWSTFPSPTTMRIANTLKRESGLPWVADFRDPLGIHRARQTGARFKPNRLAEKIDADVVANADLLVFTTGHAAQLYAEVYGERASAKALVIENGFNEDVFGEVEGQLAQRSADQAPFTLLHSGDLYGGRNPGALFEAMAGGGGDHGAMQVNFRGASNYSAFVEQARSLGLDSQVAFLPVQPYRDSIVEMLEADALLLLQSELFYNQVPGKVYEYLRCRKPILALTKPGSAVAQLLADVGHALVADIDSSRDIQPALARLQSMSVADQFDVGRYDRYARTRELAAQLDRLAR